MANYGLLTESVSLIRLGLREGVIVVLMIVCSMALFSHNAAALDSREKRAVEVAKKIRYYVSTRVGGEMTWNNYLPGATWDADPTVIDQVSECYPEIIPYLGKELSNKRLEVREAATFFLVDYFGDLASLNELVRYSLENNGNISEKIFSMFSLAFIEPISEELDDYIYNPKTKKTTAYKYKIHYIQRWLEAYGRLLVDTDFGLGLKMPEEKIRPVRENGVVIETDFRGMDVLEKWKELKKKWYLSNIFHLSISDSYSYVKFDRALPFAATDLNMPKSSFQKDKTWSELADRYFKELFAENMKKFPSYWPYYSVIGKHRDIARVIGYFDHDHRPHGPWHTFGELYEVVSTEWYVHGERSTEAEYVKSGGYDFSRTVPLLPDEAASMEKLIVKNAKKEE